MDGLEEDIGDWVSPETRRSYEERCEWHADKNKKLWAELLKAMTGDAKPIAMCRLWSVGRKDTPRNALLTALQPIFSDSIDFHHHNATGGNWWQSGGGIT
jgi:hypothetical protein